MYKAKKTVTLIIVFILLITVFSGCKKQSDDESDTMSASADNIVKSKIDSLYVSEPAFDRELLNISEGKTYTTTGDNKQNNSAILTDGIYGDDVSTSGKWAAFDYSSDITIDVELGDINEGIASFSVDILQLIPEKIFLPDEVRVLASPDGAEYIEVGLMIRDKTKDDNASSMYNLTLPGGIKASKIRFTLKSDKTGSAYVDEVCVYKYGEEALKEKE
ncbi:MAG: hypothetical protein PHD46_01570, partial [Eubacteriales bacterium]|nr:hypothetical protein [Eubacteriales bacterium]